MDSISSFDLILPSPPAQRAPSTSAQRGDAPSIGQVEPAEAEKKRGQRTRPLEEPRVPGNRLALSRMGRTLRSRAEGPRPGASRSRAELAAEQTSIGLMPPGPALAMIPRVLIIDEDDDLLQMARGILGADGYLVDTAFSALDGLHKALRFPPDVIILDVLMTGCDGMEIFDTLRQHERTGHVPVLALSSLAGRDAARLLLDIGFAALIEKPVDWPILRRELRRRAGSKTA